MSKINRYTGDVKAIASNSQAGERFLFGSTTLTSDELTAQFTAELLRGWGTVGAADYPPLEWFNSVAFTATQFNAYLHQIGVAEWDAAQEYNNNSISNRNGVIYVSKSDANIGNDPDVDLVNWVDPLLVVASIGTNQTWQDVAVSRTFNVTYTNDTGRPIFIAIYPQGSYSQTLKVDGITIGFLSSLVNLDAQLSGIVPNGSTYVLESSGGAIGAWAELR